MSRPDNAAIAATLRRYADLLDLSGDNPYRGRAYRRAAEGVEAAARPVAPLAETGDLRSVPGVGEGIAAAVRAYVRTGVFPPLQELEASVPATLLDLVAVPGVGLKTAARLYRELGVTDLSGLEAAATAGRVRALRGLGPGSETKILAGLAVLRRRTGRTPLGRALPAARALASEFATELPAGARVAISGGVRRWEETVGDLDFVVGTADPALAGERLRRSPSVLDVLDESPDRLRLRVGQGFDVDVLFAPPGRFGTALLCATGPPAHLDLLPAPLPEAEEEHAVYAALGLAPIPPELRQGRDEVALARAGTLPRLVEPWDFGGEFHCHSSWSDGMAPIADMVDAARGRGYRFLAITDHSRGLAVANGLDPERLAAQRREIDALGGDGFTILAGSEVEVHADGSLDLPDENLAALDVVVASLHSALGQPRDVLTDRLVRVLENPLVDIVAHPSGRLIERREGGDFDWDRVFATAARTGTALEINADPARLDLNGDLARRALAAGCLLTVNCDAHHPAGFQNLEYGVATARRAGATPDRVLNCWPTERVVAWLRGRGFGRGT